MPRERSAVPAGDRYEHYAVVRRNEPARNALANTITRLAKGDCPTAVQDALASAKLIPLLKPNGNIRPIACGRILRRIATTAVCKVAAPQLSDPLHRYQYAAGRAGGAEDCLLNPSDAADTLTRLMIRW